MPLSRREFISKLLASSLALGATSQGRAETYQVKRGDTLSSIAQKHGVSVNQLKRANKLSDDLIFEKQLLQLPANSNSSLTRAIDATNALTVPMRSWQMVVAHHSAIEFGNAAIYHKEHVRRGMHNGLAYHFVIGNGIDSGDGEIEVGNRWIRQLAGGHVRSQAINNRGIGICLVGNFENHAPSDAQIRSLTNLVDFLKKAAIKKDFLFTEHRLVDPGHTVCPGRYFPSKKIRSRYA